MLRRIGAWDPYNVTEDADLGMRLARFGYRTAVIPSTTYEEAPVRFRPWLRQRTRWFKGWMRLVKRMIFSFVRKQLEYSRIATEAAVATLSQQSIAPGRWQRRGIGRCAEVRYG